MSPATEAAPMTELLFPAGHVFFRPDDPGDRAFQVLAGLVEVTAAGDRDDRAGLFGPGDVFGEMSLIEERPHRATARAVGPVRVSCLSRDEFDRLLLTDPARCRPYLVTLFERLRVLSSQMRRVADPTPSDAETVFGLRAIPGSAIDPASAQTTPETAALTVESSAVAEPARPVGPRAFPPADPTDPPPAVRVVVYPLTRAAARTLPDDGLVVTRFPLRIGRTSAGNEPEPTDLNDLWLLDERPYNVSRNHCAIDLTGRGVVVRDRGSQLGCLVNDTRVGGPAVLPAAALLPGENVLILGGAMSPYQFRVTVGPPG